MGSFSINSLPPYDELVSYLKDRGYVIEIYEYREGTSITRMSIARKPWQLPDKEYFIVKIYNKEIYGNINRKESGT